MSVSRLKLRNTENYMVGFSNRLIKLLKIEIGRNRKRTYAPTKTFPNGRTINKPIDSTGSLRKSLETHTTKSGMKGFALGIRGNSYGKDVDEGSDLIAPNVDKIVQWIKAKPVRLRDARGRFINRSAASIRNIAGLIAEKIENEGTEPTNFIDDAIGMAMQQIATIANPIEKDIYLNLDEILKRAGYTKKGDEYIIE